MRVNNDSHFLLFWNCYLSFLKTTLAGISQQIVITENMCFEQYLSAVVIFFLPRIGFVNILRDVISAVVILLLTAMCCL